MTKLEKAKKNTNALIEGLKTHRSFKSIDELAGSICNKYIELVEQQTPKRHPNVEGAPGCICGQLNVGKFCPDCGQAIDREDGTTT